MRILLFTFLITIFAIPAYAEKETWVTVDRLNRRTCPNTSCGVVGRLFFREKATIYEEQDGWARISKYYPANCQYGKNMYVDSGNKKCNAQNGVGKDGKFAEWVSIKFLSSERPADPAEKASVDYTLVKGSDDFRIYKDAFLKAANDLIKTGRCRPNDFLDMGGWMKSTNQRTQPVYFTYCGGMRKQNKVYLNAETGKVK